MYKATLFIQTNIYPVVYVHVEQELLGKQMEYV